MTILPIILVCAISGGSETCRPAAEVNPAFAITRFASNNSECWKMAEMVLAQNSDMLGGKPYRVRCDRIETGKIGGE